MLRRSGNVRYYPHWEPTRSSSGKWEARVRFGEPNDTEQQFEIAPVLLNVDGARVVQDYVQQAQKSGEWPGLLQFPAGSEEMAPIRVTRFPPGIPNGCGPNE